MLRLQCMLCGLSSWCDLHEEGSFGVQISAGGPWALRRMRIMWEGVLFHFWNPWKPAGVPKNSNFFTFSTDFFTFVNILSLHNFVVFLCLFGWNGCILLIFIQLFVYISFLAIQLSSKLTAFIKNCWKRLCFFLIFVYIADVFKCQYLLKINF